MIKLIKQDLAGFLCLIGERRPALDADSLALDIRKLERCEAVDYLFLARREKSYLFPVEDVYEPDSYAYLCWTAYILLPDVPVDAFYLHVSDTAMGPSGSIVLLDYTESAADVMRIADFTPEQRAAHVRRRMRRWQARSQITTTLAFVKALEGGDPTWTQAAKQQTSC